MTGPKKASAKSSACRARKGTVCTATIHPADAKVRGTRRLWARGVRALALDSDCSEVVVRKALASGELDPLDLLGSSAWVCSRLGDHETAARLRALKGRRF